MPGDIVRDRVNELYRGEIFEWETQQICRDRVHWICSQVIGDDVLDVGCSQGITSLILGREAHRVVGVDTSQTTLDYAIGELNKESEDVKRNVQFRLASGDALPFPDESFDTVILGELVEHLTRPERVLAESHRVLRPQGRVIITTPFGVHPHPDHVRTFYFSSFLGLVGKFFGIQSLRAVDGYVNCVGIKGASDAADDGEPWSIEKLLVLSESAFLAKEHRYWDKHKNLTKQRDQLREDLDKVKGELVGLKKTSAELSPQTAALRQKTERWNKASVAAFNEVHKFLMSFNGDTNMGILAGRIAPAMAKAGDDQAAEVAIDLLPTLLIESLKHSEDRWKRLLGERDAKFAELETASRNQIARLTQEQAATLAAMHGDHIQQKRQLEETIQRFQKEELSQRRLLEQQIEATKHRHDLEMEALNARHQDQIRQLQEASERHVVELERQHALDIHGLKESHVSWICKLEEDSESRLLELQRQHALAFERLQETHRRQREEDLAATHRTQQEQSKVVGECQQKVAQAKEESDRRLAEMKRQRETETRTLQAELDKTRTARTRAEQTTAQLQTRLNSLMEYHRRTEELHLEEVRYRLGDALVRALGSPIDFLRLPGRMIKLFFAGLRRRRDRQEQETPDVAARASVQPAPTRSPAAISTSEAKRVSTVAPQMSLPAPTPAVTQAPSPVDNPAPAPNPKPVPRTAPTAVSSSPPAKVAGAEVFEKAPFAPHLGTGCDPKATLFPRVAGQSRRRVAGVFDEFSRDCFAPEFDLVAFRPDNWANVLKTMGADLLLVESAWHGNDGSWQYRIASYAKNMGEELRDLIECCKRNGVPTVFWNKEDPSHFDRFIERAGLFDVVLTTDADCIPKYRERLGHDRVYTLPFAAQPSIHNPIQTESRLAKSCFAGAYYIDRFEQRQEDMLCLLRPAMRTGLDIFDRMHDAAPKDKQNYLFPEEFQPAIRGRLEYPEMVKAYKRYRVFLNVNSVKQSPTMCSRRVFELLASGTPVVSTYAKGIERLVGDEGVFLVKSEQEALKTLETLLGDDEAWALASARGVRKVLSEHTYAHRFADVCERAGVTHPGVVSPKIAVIIPLASEADTDAAIRLIAGQSYADFEVHLFASQQLSNGQIERIRNAAQGRPVRCWNLGANAGGSLTGFMASTLANIVCSMRVDATYGRDYLDEAAMFFRIPGVDVIGKACHWRAGQNGALSLVGKDEEQRWVTNAASATISVWKSVLTDESLRRLLTEPQFRSADRPIYSTYRYGFIAGDTGRTVTEVRWQLGKSEGR